MAETQSKQWAAGATLTNPVTEELQAITNGKGFKDGYL